MRLLMGISKNRHGTYYAIKQVPTHLQEAVARVLDNGKARQSWLKRSLGTKDAERANRLAKPVLIEFDRTLDRARALVVERPLRASLSPVELKRIVEYHYANKLASFDAFVRDAPEIEAETRRLDPELPWDGPIPEFGLSGGQLFDLRPERIAHVRQEEIPRVQRATRARQPRLASLGVTHRSSKDRLRRLFNSQVLVLAKFVLQEAGHDTLSSARGLFGDWSLSCPAIT